MLNEIVFLVLAVTIVVAAIKMLNAVELMHSAVFLGVVLAGVAGIYLTLGAELLAAVQVLIYVGAVLTLMLFAIMFTQQGAPTEGFGEDRTPLSVLGIQAPQGMDVESLREVPDEATTVREAEASADAVDEDAADEAADEAGTDEHEGTGEDAGADDERRTAEGGSTPDEGQGDEEEE